MVNIVVLQADDRQFGLVVDAINDTAGNRRQAARQAAEGPERLRRRHHHGRRPRGADPRRARPRRAVGRAHRRAGRHRAADRPPRAGRVRPAELPRVPGRVVRARWPCRCRWWPGSRSSRASGSSTPAGGSSSSTAARSCTSCQLVGAARRQAVDLTRPAGPGAGRRLQRPRPRHRPDRGPGGRHRRRGDHGPAGDRARAGSPARRSSATKVTDFLDLVSVIRVAHEDWFGDDGEARDHGDACWWSTRRRSRGRSRGTASNWRATASCEATSVGRRGGPNREGRVRRPGGFRGPAGQAVRRHSLRTVRATQRTPLGARVLAVTTQRGGPGAGRRGRRLRRLPAAIRPRGAAARGPPAPATRGGAEPPVLEMELARGADT